MDKAGKKVALKTPQKQKSTLRPQDLSLGDSVKVMSLNVKGTVSSKPDSKGMLFVQMGILRSKVHISDLQLIDEPVITGPALSRTGAGKIKMNKSASVRTEINLLGKTVDEAVSELDKYLDDANYIINNGTYAPELNGYVSFMSGKKYGFVGLDRTTGDITTFHIKNISELIKKAPSLGFER